MRAPTVPSTIPQFALYGETSFRHKPEFVHIEDISVRSERNGWVIKPHRHGHLFQVIAIFSGGADVYLDDRTSSHRGGWVVCVPAGVVHGFRFRPNTEGVVLSVAVNMVGLDTDNQFAALLRGVLSSARTVKFQANSQLFKEFVQYLGLIRQELAIPRHEQQLALFSLVKMVLVSLRRRLHQERIEESDLEGGARLTTRFRSLLEQHYKQHWKIADYAKALHVSASTLNRTCQDVLGASTKKIIQERLHVEARRRLIYTRETLDQIAFDLGFKDSAYFSRVFKQTEGVPPMAYRRTADLALSDVG